MWRMDSDFYIPQLLFLSPQLLFHISMECFLTPIITKPLPRSSCLYIAKAFRSWLNIYFLQRGVSNPLTLGEYFLSPQRIFNYDFFITNHVVIIMLKDFSTNSCWSICSTRMASWIATWQVSSKGLSCIRFLINDLLIIIIIYLSLLFINKSFIKNLMHSQWMNKFYQMDFTTEYITFRVSKVSLYLVLGAITNIHLYIYINIHLYMGLCVVF